MKHLVTIFFLLFSFALFNNCSPGFVLPESNGGEANNDQGELGDNADVLPEMTLKVDSIVAPLIDQAGNDPSKARSMVVGIVYKGQPKLLFYGKDDQGNRPNAKSVYPLNSITKMLTGIITARGIIDGDFGLSIPARNLINGQLANSIDPNIRMGMLLAHYSGLPDLPSNLSGPDGSRASNYSRGELISCLTSLCNGATAPGSGYAYSNMGLGIAAIALEDFYGAQNYQELFNEKMAKDLGLNDTHLSEMDFYPVDYEQRIVLGRTPGGNLIPPAEMGILAGAGGLLTTGEDMLKLSQMLAKPDSRWAPIMNEASKTIAAKDADTNLAYGFESYMNDSDQVFAKAGGQIGFGSYIAWSPSLESAVFILIDQGGTRFMKNTTSAIVDAFQEGE